jgi:hypothetical protein
MLYSVRRDALLTVDKPSTACFPARGRRAPESGQGIADWRYWRSHG